VKKFLVILTLALALCLLCSVAMAENEYKAVFKGSTLVDNTDVTDLSKYEITDDEGNTVTPGAGSYAEIEPGYTIVHLQKNWVMLHINVVVSGVEITETLHVPVLLHEAQHDWKASTGKDDQCREYDKECSICHEKILKDPVVYAHNTYEKYLEAYTCTEEGKFVLACKDCGKELGDVKTVDAHHDLAYEWTKRPTCVNEKKGTLRVYCTGCDLEEVFENVPLAQYKSGFTQPLTKFGAYAGNQSIDVKASTDLDDNGHEMEPWQLLVARSCFSAKEEIRWCKLCREYFETRKDVTNGPLDPVFEPMYVSCTELGKVVKNCLICGGEAGGTHRVEYANLAAAVADPDIIETHTYDHTKAPFEKLNWDNVNDTYLDCTTKPTWRYKCVFQDEAKYAANHVGTHVYEYDEQPAHVKTWTEWELVVEPDADGNETGFWRRACINEWGTAKVPCGEVERHFSELPPASACKEHTWVIDEANSVAPTCTKAGVNAYICSVCNTAKEETEVVPAKDHTWKVEAKIEATCSAAGKIVSSCEVCGIVKTEAIEKTAHTVEEIAAVPATCVAEGKTAGQKCSVCGEVIVAQKAIPATGEHTWNDGEIVTEATCTKEGKKLITCTVCGLTKTEAIEKIAHTPVEVAEVPATCKDTGVKAGKKCSVCGEELEGFEVIPADETAHVWEEEVLVEATCTKAGTALKTCSVCGKTEKAEVAKLAHTPGEPEVTPATTEKEGSKVVKCTVCGEVLSTEVLPKELGETEFTAEVEFGDMTLTGKAEQKEGTKEAKAVYARVTYFMADGTYVVVSVPVEADGTFESMNSGNVIHVSVQIVDSAKVRPGEFNRFGGAEFDVK
jgi:hypothetical protein